MQVNALGNSFTGRRENITAFVNLDDETIQKIAYERANAKFDNKKFKRQQRFMDFALPIAGGLSTAAVAESGKRLGAFLKGFGSWGVFIAAVAGIFGLQNAVINHSQKVEEFNKKHPFISFVTAGLAAFGAATLAIRGGVKGFEKLSQTGVYKDKLVPFAKKMLTKVKDNAFTKTASDAVKNIISKTPSALKEAGKFVASWAPETVILGSIIHSVKNGRRFSNEYIKNYSNMKLQQQKLAQARIRELEMENDFLLTKPENVEDIEEYRNLMDLQ